RVVDALIGAHVADVNHALDALRDLNEGTELGQVRHGTFDYGAHGKFTQHISPGIAERLLEPKRDAAFGGINAEDDHFDNFAGLDHIARDADLFCPGHF